MFGKLIVGGMDIGSNLDLGQRIKNAIIDSDYILVESLQNFTDKCNSINIVSNAILIEYNNQIDNKNKVTNDVIDYLKDNKTILIISDDGMPGICDPGLEIVRLAFMNNIDVTVIPGPSIISALPSISGLNTNTFIFQQELSIDKTVRIYELQNAKNSKRSFMFIIPNRINHNRFIHEIFEDIIDVYGNKIRIAVGIDLTMDTELIKMDHAQNIQKWLKEITILDHTNISVFIENATNQ